MSTSTIEWIDLAWNWTPGGDDKSAPTLFLVDCKYQEGQAAVEKAWNDLPTFQYLDSVGASPEQTAPTAPPSMLPVDAPIDVRSGEPVAAPAEVVVAAPANASLTKPPPVVQLPEQGYFRLGDQLFYLREGKYHPPKGKGGVGYKDRDEPILLCSGNFEVDATVKNEAGRNVYLVSFRDSSGELVSLQISTKLQKGALISELLDRGLKIGEDRGNKLLLEYIRVHEPERHLTAVSTRCVGKWFITSEGVFGPPGGEKYIFDEEFEDCLEVKGTAASWRRTIGIHCPGNQHMTYAASKGFASAVLQMMGASTCLGTHFYGLSSLGKSTTSYVAMSVPGTKELMSCDNSEPGVEQEAVRHSHVILALDEIKQSTKQKAAIVAGYALRIGNGRSRGIFKAKGKGKGKYLTWLLCWITSGEHSFPAFLQMWGLPPLDAGEKLRLISLPAEIGPHGSFNTIFDFKDSKEFAEQIRRWTEENKGAIFIEWVRLVFQNYEQSVRRLNEIKTKFADAEKRKCPSLPLWVARVLDNIAMVAAAGEYATELGVTGWPRSWGLEAASKEFALWYRTQYKPEDQIELGALQVFTWIDENKDSVKFGNHKGRIICYVAEDDFKRACAPFDHQDVARELRRQGKLIQDKDGHLTRQKRIEVVKSRRFWVVMPGDSGYAGDEPDDADASDDEEET